MKSFLHSRSPGCSVGVVIPMHEQHHWLLFLWMTLSFSLSLFFCNSLPNCISLSLFSPYCSQNRRKKIPCVSVLHFDHSPVRVLSVHSGIRCCISWCWIPFFWRSNMSSVCCCTCCKSVRISASAISLTRLSENVSCPFLDHRFLIK